jgi:hypothetical protein
VRRRIVDGDDPALGPGLGQQPHVGAEPVVARRLGQPVKRPLDMLRERGRQAALELLEGGREIRVVLVRVADHQSRGQDDGHGLLLGQLQRWQERLLVVDPPHAILAPDRQPKLRLERRQIAIDRPHGHPDPRGDVRRAHPLGVGLEDRYEPGQPGQPVALGRIPPVVVIEGHRLGG